MEKVLDKKIAKELKHTSKIMGVDESELINRAVLLFLKNVREETQLREELDMWNAASDEALINMDKEIASMV